VKPWCKLVGNTDKLKYTWRTPNETHTPSCARAQSLGRGTHVRGGGGFATTNRRYTYIGALKSILISVVHHTTQQNVVGVSRAEQSPPPPAALCNQPPAYIFYSSGALVLSLVYGICGPAVRVATLGTGVVRRREENQSNDLAAGSDVSRRGPEKSSWLEKMKIIRSM